MSKLKQLRALDGVFECKDFVHIKYFHTLQTWNFLRNCTRVGRYKLMLPPFPGTSQHVRLPPFYTELPPEAQAAPPGIDTVEALGSKVCIMFLFRFLGV